MVHQYNYCIANNLHICCTYTRTWISRFKVRWCSPVKQRSAYTVYFRHNDLLLLYHVVNYSKLLEVQHLRLIFKIRYGWFLISQCIFAMTREILTLIILLVVRDTAPECVIQSETTSKLSTVT